LEAAIEGVAARILKGAMQTTDSLRDDPKLNSRLTALRRPWVRPA